jgi:hypothetical protein
MSFRRDCGDERLYPFQCTAHANQVFQGQLNHNIFNLLCFVFLFLLTLAFSSLQENEGVYFCHTSETGKSPSNTMIWVF